MSADEVDLKGRMLRSPSGNGHARRSFAAVDDRGIVGVGKISSQLHERRSRLAAARFDNGATIVTWQFRSPWLDLDPPASHMGIADAGALNPLHPVHRLRNLRPGQRWVQPLTDPLADAQRMALSEIAKRYTGVDFKQFAGPAKAKNLLAEVAGPKSLEWHDEMQDCYVITYRGDNYAASTWVRVADGLVLRQEASSSGDEWTLQRD